MNKAEDSPKQTPFAERRTEVRLWCSDIVHVWWKDGEKWNKIGVAVLEDISPSGMCIQVENTLPHGAMIRIKHAEWKVEGEIRYCLQREEGHFVGVRLSEKFRWSVQDFRPLHLTDPSKVTPKKEEEE